MRQIRWDRFPLVAQSSRTKTWLQLQSNLGLAVNTVEAYGRALEDYLAFSGHHSFSPDSASREHIAAYVHHLLSRPNRQGIKTKVQDSCGGLANATIQQRLTVIRLYYDFLIEEGIRADHPVGRGRYTPGKAFGGQRDRILIPHYRKLPWIPTDEQWIAILQAARAEPLRNQLMLALGYDAGLRREELCSLATSDFDPSARLLRIRAETTKNRQERVVPYSAASSSLYAAYLRERRKLSDERGPMFLSESRRNRAQPASIWTWTKVVKGIAERSSVHQFTSHTLRHLCLTDLARAGWDIHEIAQFAGHRSIQTTLLYIHLSGRELADKLEHGMAAIHAWRIQKMAEVFA